MNGLYEAALETQQFMEEHHWQFCIIGGLAVVRWGEPQATQDVDVSLLTGFGKETAYIEEILSSFASRIANARQFALENRVLLISASNGVPIDIALAGIPFEERLIGRASPFEFAPGVTLTTCSAEDLVVLKTFAGRPKDWVAVEGILIRRAKDLDWTCIRRELRPLCELKGEPELVERLEALREDVESQ